MTNILLAIIIALLLVRIALQVRHGKRAFEKMYCAPSEVENVEAISTYKHLSATLRTYSEIGYEFVQMMPNYCGHEDMVQLFFYPKENQ